VLKEVDFKQQVLHIKQQITTRKNRNASERKPKGS